MRQPELPEAKKVTKEEIGIKNSMVVKPRSLSLVVTTVGKRLAEMAAKVLTRQQLNSAL